MIVNTQIEFSTEGNDDLVDLTPMVSEILEKNGLKSGLIHLFVPGATGALTTIEYEQGLIEDWKNTLRQVITDSMEYKHNLTWGDGNAHSHLRASLVGPSLTIPVDNQHLVLGTWQQIVFADFDNRARKRSIHCQLIGDFNVEKSI